MMYLNTAGSERYVDRNWSSGQHTLHTHHQMES